MGLCNEEVGDMNVCKIVEETFSPRSFDTSISGEDLTVDGITSSDSRGDTTCDPNSEVVAAYWVDGFSETPIESSDTSGDTKEFVSCSLDDEKQSLKCDFDIDGEGSGLEFFTIYAICCPKLSASRE